jgi:hypothetical protein
LARSRFPNDPDLADLAAREAYEKDENVAYAQQEKLYGSYGRAWEAEEVAHVALDEEEERVFLELLHRQPLLATPTNIQADIAAANAMLTVARVALRES